MCIIYRRDTLSFTADIQNVFLVKVSNRNYAHCVFCIPQLCFGHKKHVGHNSYSKDLIRRYLCTDLELFKGIEMVMAATVVGCIKFGLESVAESMISKYNLHSSDIRPISDDALHSEMIVNCNGPSINEADNILSEVASYYFSKQKTNQGWRFVTKNNVEEKFGAVLKRKWL